LTELQVISCRPDLFRAERAVDEAAQLALNDEAAGRDHGCLMSACWS